MKDRNPGLFWMLVGLVVGVVLIGGGLAIFVLPGRLAESSALNAGEEILYKVGKPWNGAALFAASDQLAANHMTRESSEQLAQFMDYYYGSVVSVKAKITNMTEIGDHNGTYTNAEYTANVVFEKQPATLNIELSRRNGTWYINFIRVAAPTAGTAQ